MKAAGLALVLALALAACGGGGGDSSSDSGSLGTATPGQLALYKYDASSPVGLRDKGVLKFAKPYPIKFHDISYLSPKGGYVPGYLVTPPGKGPYPGVILLHGSGEDRQTLLSIASWLAARGMVTMTIDAADSRPRPSGLQSGGALKQQRDIAVQTVLDARRGIDLLHAWPQVGKSSPVGFLGFSAGGKSGAVLAGVEPRLKAVVLVSAGAPSLKKVVDQAPKNAKATVTAMLGATDPARFIGRDTAPLLIQIGKKDQFVPQADLQALVDAAPKSAVVTRYPDGHILISSKAAVHDMLDFLSKKLGAGPQVEGADVGP
ncbi:MAG TPA: dienelactone hydrolase family protein [Gaiellaceae bacterium]|nr:dienelactone hydrolase family protein [Gaiellaceae bacterium]